MMIYKLIDQLRINDTTWYKLIVFNRKCSEWLKRYPDDQYTSYSKGPDVIGEVFDLHEHLYTLLLLRYPNRV